jgi:hypothetical protein
MNLKKKKSMQSAIYYKRVAQIGLV